MTTKIENHSQDDDELIQLYITKRVVKLLDIIKQYDEDATREDVIIFLIDQYIKRLDTVSGMILEQKLNHDNDEEVVM